MLQHTATATALGKILKDFEQSALISVYWKANNDNTFLSLTAHYIQDDKVASKTLAAQEVIADRTQQPTPLRLLLIFWQNGLLMEKW